VGRDEEIQDRLIGECARISGVSFPEVRKRYAESGDFLAFLEPCAKFGSFPHPYG